MENIRSAFRKIKLNENLTPIAFLLIAIAGFGLLANRLGYYQDDWPYIFYAFNKGISSLKIEMYYDSRPNAAWMYISLFKLLGFKPIAWHITALITRWLTATTLWYFLKRLWPSRTREITFAIFIFLVHPFFLIQPYAMNSMLYWSGFLFFSLSLYLMAHAVTDKKYFIPFTILAVALEALHLFTNEYFVGMVLIRPLILYWLFSSQFPNIKTRITKTIANWLPYLAALIAYLVWRMFLYVPPPIGDRNSPKILYALLESPLKTIWYLIRTAIQDSIIVTFTSWYRTLVPELFSFATIFNWFVLIVSALTFIGVFFYLTKSLPDESQEPDRWFASPLTLGLLIVLLGMVPLWIIGQDIVTHKNEFAGSRFGIGATLGASLILAVIIENLLDDLKKKIAVISLVIALAVSMHLTNAKDFSYSWEKQSRLARELLWRAPGIEPGTAIVTDEEILGYMGSYSVSYALITTYQPGDISTPPYWYFPFYYTNPNVNDFLSGIPLEDNKLTMNFTGNSKKMLLLSFNPEMQRCLWILQPQDTNLRLVSDDMRKLSAGSDIGLIKMTEGEPPNPPEDIYGKTNTQTWCYYFEKADLARQYGQWEEIVRLWNEAQAAGERPDNGFEYIPFIEGFGHTGDWQQVKEMTKFAKRVSAGLEPSLCSAMDRLAETAPASQQRDETISELKNNLDCSSYQ
ncbi:MAG: hypothetical protein H6634_15725 [Anaerolineales bacterium]|nr:hypothetical protein [Anaerolineales bacterium]